MEKVKFLDFTEYLYDEKDEDDKGRRRFISFDSILHIECVAETKEIHEIYRDPQIKVITCDYEICLKDIPKTREYLKQFFDLPPSFDESF